MLGTIFAIVITMVLPVCFLIYAIINKSYLPFLLGIMTFVISQIFFRLPIIDYLQSHSASYNMFSATHPFWLMILIALSAGLVEEIGRYIMMQLFMKQKSFKNGILFGLGHGGIEAVLLVGLSAVGILFSAQYSYGDAFFTVVLSEL